MASDQFRRIPHWITQVPNLENVEFITANRSEMVHVKGYDWREIGEGAVLMRGFVAIPTKDSDGNISGCKCVTPIPPVQWVYILSYADTSRGGVTHMTPDQSAKNSKTDAYCAMVRYMERFAGNTCTLEHHHSGDVSVIMGSGKRVTATVSIRR